MELQLKDISEPIENIESYLESKDKVNNPRLKSVGLSKGI